MKCWRNTKAMSQRRTVPCTTPCCPTTPPFKHALVHLTCASASHKTQQAYALANGDVASFADAMETDIDALNASISQQTRTARERLSAVYLLSLAVGTAAAAACILLVFADLRLITRYVVIPIKSMLKAIQESSGHINGMTAEVLKRTRDSRKSAAGLSSLAGNLSSTFRDVAAGLSQQVRTFNTTGKIQDLRQQVASGEYRPDARETAARMLLLSEGE